MPSVTEARISRIAGEASTRRALTTSMPSAAPAGGTGAAAGGWDTAPNRDAAITTINTMRTVLNELIVILRARGIVE